MELLIGEGVQFLHEDGESGDHCRLLDCTDLFDLGNVGVPELYSSMRECLQLLTGDFQFSSVGRI